MRTQMSTRVQRLEARLRTLEEARFAQWLRACPTEDLMRYVTDETEAELASLSTLSNEQLLRLYNGESLSAVLSE